MANIGILAKYCDKGHYRSGAKYRITKAKYGFFIVLIVLELWNAVHPYYHTSNNNGGYVVQ